MSRWPLIGVALVLAGCPGPEPTDGSDLTDATDATDSTDSTDSTDATDDTDPPGPVEIYGDGPYDCDFVLTSDLSDPNATFRQTAVLLDGEPEAQDLSAGGQEVVDDGNLNPNSLQSELLAYEVLHRCEGAELVYTESEVPYKDPDGKKTDLVLNWDGSRIGVSVTRAVGYPPENPWGVDKAEALLSGKLADIPLSSDNVQEGEAWTKQILFVAAYAPEHERSLQSAWEGLNDELKGNITVVVVTTEGDDDFVYFR